MGDSYNSLKQGSSDAVEHSTLQSYFENNGKDLFFFNCGLFVNTDDCAHGCNAADRTAVLTTHQWNVFDESMIEAKTRFLNNIVNLPLKRAALQTIFQYYKIANKKQCETLDTKNITPQNNHRKYLSLFIGQVKKLGKRTNNFAYIRKGNPQSDFDDIKKDARLSNLVLVACDEF